ncbi:glycosyltransferase family 61 protein [Pontibacter sp. KCTC 32443]|uniref:glycosyltransferase family 61 protein n=1 Tax=Pontibacter TaxID=323449 RepID=UPI00164DCAE7|nr:MULTISPECIES: glycosyltransferase family 61 protein [Pontibacter]MBC5773498.1 glycosyltransferase family 61 protein [Pontibacter sp. KCTC 32443]
MLKHHFKRLIKTILAPIKFDFIINARGVVSIKEELSKLNSLTNYLILYNSESIKRKPAKSLFCSHWKFEKGAPGLVYDSEEVFIANLQDVKIVGRNGAVLTNKNEIIKDVTVEIGRNIYDHSLLHQVVFKKPIYIKYVSTVVAAADASNNYFHWMFDVIPRIGWVLHSKSKLQDIKVWFINSRKQPFQNETLNHIGIEKTSTIELDVHDYYVCDNLVIPSLSGLSGNASIRVVNMIRYLFKEWMIESENNSQEPIFISRNNASKRKISNFKELRPVLQDLGVKVIELESMSVSEQVKLFYNTNLIIGVHGAGLSNLVFCKPGSTVVEIFSPNYVNQCYWTIASHVDLNYHYLVGEGSIVKDTLNHLLDEDIVLDIHKFQALVEQILNRENA